MKTTIITNWHNSFGFITDKRKSEIKETPEETFKHALNSLPKKIQNNWESIEFEFNGSIISVRKDWLIETNFNWELSHEIL